MKISAVSRCLERNFEAKLPVLLVGAPGIGKTDVVQAAASSTKHKLLVSHPVVEDPTYARGFPVISKDGKSASFIPFDTLAAAVKATEPTVWFLDDLGQASPAMQAAYMQLLLARRVGEHVLSDFVTFVAATNRKGDRAGVSGLLEPVKSRFKTIVHVEVCVDAWVNWALRAGMPAELIAFIQFHGAEMLHKHNPTTELVNSRSPRTWGNAGMLINAGLDVMNVDDQEELAGAVGQDGANDFVTFCKNFASLFPVDEIFVNPKGCGIPDELSAMHMLVNAAAMRASKANVKSVMTYAERLVQAGHGEMGTYLVRKSVLCAPELAKTAAYSKYLASDAGKLMQ